MAQQSVKPPFSHSSDVTNPIEHGNGEPGIAELSIADLIQHNGLTDRYDQTLFTLCDTSACGLTQGFTQGITDSITDNTTRFCHHIRHALNADTAYICNRHSLTIVSTSSTNSAQQICSDTEEQHAALTSMVSDLWNCTEALCPPDVKVFADETSFSFCVLPIHTDHDHLLVLTNAEVEKELIGHYITDAITTIYKAFLQCDQLTPEHATLESSVLDSLHKKYQVSSQAITEKRHRLFCGQVQDSAVEFEGLTLINIKDKPEALATTLPNYLYETAALWNNKFKATLDNHCLKESVYGYKTLCDNENLSKFSDGRTLGICVHAETLTDFSFIESLTELLEKALIHSSKLQFNVVPLDDHDHTEALQNLCVRFGMAAPASPAPLSNASNTVSPASIAEEFNVMQLHGVNTFATANKTKGTSD